MAKVFLTYKQKTLKIIKWKKKKKSKLLWSKWSFNFYIQGKIQMTYILYTTKEMEKSILGWK